MQYLDENRLLEILEDYNKATLYKKTGFVLEHYGDRLRLSKDFFYCCRQKDNVGSKLLASSEACTKFDSKWRIYYPEIFYDLLQQDDYEIV